MQRAAPVFCRGFPIGHLKLILQNGSATIALQPRPRPRYDCPWVTWGAVGRRGKTVALPEFVLPAGNIRLRFAFPRLSTGTPLNSIAPHTIRAQPLFCFSKAPKHGRGLVFCTRIVPNPSIACFNRMVFGDRLTGSGPPTKKRVWKSWIQGPFPNGTARPGEWSMPLAMSRGGIPS